jgi:uncharacterized membrane protein (UPF0127 family)
MAHFLQPIARNPSARWTLVVERSEARLASQVELALDAAARKRGLLGRDAMPEDTAFVIAPSNAVHTFFMRFPIDLVFADRSGRVVKVRHDVRPWRVSGALGAFAVIELGAGSAATAGLVPGDRLLVIGATPAGEAA